MNSEQDFAIIKLSERVYIANSSSLLLFQSHSRETLIRSHSKGSLLRAKVASFIGIIVTASDGLIIRFPFNCLVMHSGCSSSDMEKQIVLRCNRLRRVLKLRL